MSLIAIDSGTTNSRAWLLNDSEIIWQNKLPVGLRDCAIANGPSPLHHALAELIQQANAAAGNSPPTSIIAAGMLGSPLGLCELPHLSAPTHLADLRAAITERYFHAISPLPVRLVPGVKTIHQQIEKCDIMRGEETLAMGLLANGQYQAPFTLLTLGSHWKSIQIDAQGRIISSRTSIGGELLHGVQSQSVLAASLPQTIFETIDPDWLFQGMENARRDGITRALFTIRLHHLLGNTSPEQRYNLALGACIDADIRSIETQFPIFISGNEGIAKAWAIALQQQSIHSTVLTTSQTTQAMLDGLKAICGDQ